MNNTTTQELNVNATTEETVELVDIDPRSDLSHSVIERFLDCIWVKYGMSQPTIEAYRADLRMLDRWLQLIKLKTLVRANADDVREFLKTRTECPQQARGHTPSLSCIKRFYRFLLEGGYRSDDPTESVFVRAPRLVKHDVAVIRTAPT